MTHWLSVLQELRATETSSVLVTVSGVRGSTPREIGASMIVTESSSIGTIGGGQLEHQATRHAVEMLTSSRDRQRQLRRYVLGANCGQCCGGVAEVLFEYLPGSRAEWLEDALQRYQTREAFVLVTPLSSAGDRSVLHASEAEVDLPEHTESVARAMLAASAPATVSDGYLLEPQQGNALQIAVFGAGHVGAATVDVLSRLACDIRWVDSRRNVFPPDFPDNVTPVSSQSPQAEVAAMPASSVYLVMTHSHPLDMDLCATILSRRDAAYCGLIGSRSKRRRFERQLLKQGLTDADLDSLVCPIGVSGIDGKSPAEIAIATAAEVLQATNVTAVQHAGRRLLGAIA